jgi:hypothetical protein
MWVYRAPGISFAIGSIERSTSPHFSSANDLRYSGSLVASPLFHQSSMALSDDYALGLQIIHRLLLHNNIVLGFLFQRFYRTSLKYEAELVPTALTPAAFSFAFGQSEPLNLNMTNAPTFPVSHSPSFLHPLRNQFIPVLRNYLKIVYLFTYSDFRTTLIPVVRASFLPSFDAHVSSHAYMRRPPSPSFRPPMQAHTVLCMRDFGRGYISFNSVSRTSVWIPKRTH